MSKGRWMALAALAVVTICWLAVVASLSFKHGRLPSGGGEVINWLLGL